MVDNELYNLFTEYGIALSSLQYQLNDLVKAFTKLEEDNPIEYLESRIKSAASIEEKLHKLSKQEHKNYTFNAKDIENNLNDIVGVRIVCPFLSDVYQVLATIKKSFHITILEERDYIKKPKESGYSSYHLKVLVPITIPNTKKIKQVKAEIQIRTITMDMIASLEHKFYYKKNISLSPQLKNKLSQIIQYCNRVERDLNNVLLQEKKKKNISKIYKPLPRFMKTEEFSNYLLLHQKALDIIEEKLNHFSEDYLERSNRKPFEHTKCRIKSKYRMMEKLERQQIATNFQNLNQYVHDIAGFRIVCPFLEDVESVINAFYEDKTITIIEKQDYMKNPKENGYTSCHLLVLVPVPTKYGILNVKVEVQIRTMCQEMWAILQERLCYQKTVDEEIEEDLKRLSPVLMDIDYNMNEMIKYSLEQQRNKERKVLSKSI